MDAAVPDVKDSNGLVVEASVVHDAGKDKPINSFTTNLTVPIPIPTIGSSGSPPPDLGASSKRTRLQPACPLLQFPGIPKKQQHARVAATTPTPPPFHHPRFIHHQRLWWWLATYVFPAHLYPLRSPASPASCSHVPTTSTAEPLSTARCPLGCTVDRDAGSSGERGARRSLPSLFPDSSQLPTDKTRSNAIASNRIFVLLLCYILVRCMLQDWHTTGWSKPRSDDHIKSSVLCQGPERERQVSQGWGLVACQEASPVSDPQNPSRSKHTTPEWSLQDESSL